MHLRKNAFARLLRGELHERQAFVVKALFRFLAALPALLLVSSEPAFGEEGLWTFDAFPAAQVERSLGVRLDRAWLDHLREASVRLTSGCSAAAVSPGGLIVTNQHCVIACAQNLSDPAHDYLQSGYGVGEALPERSCPGVQAEILVGIADITAPVFQVSAGKYGDDFVKARESLFARAERAACAGDPRFRCQVIGFFGGGQFKIYKYRRYDDVRLVFSPEFAVAFGGDSENFRFPRYDLDVAMLRLYERGRPAALGEWLAWSDRAPTPGEAVFISGSPGTTERALTVAQLEVVRDIANPDTEARSARLRERLLAFAARGPDAGRAVAARLFSIENELKVIRGESARLHDPAFMAGRRQDEAGLRTAVAAQPRLVSQIGDPWARVDEAQAHYAASLMPWRDLESDAGEGSRLFWYARALVRAADEGARPPPERLPEFADARLALLEKAVVDDSLVDPDLEALCLEAWLAELRAGESANADTLAAFLGPAEPAALARSLVATTRLADPAVRAALWRGGLMAIMASDDPLIAYVRRTDPLSRAARRAWEDDVQGPSEEAGERIALARLAVRGADIYPDATFSPRISFGRVAGWGEGDAAIGPFTTLGGLYAESEGAEARALPPRWLAARERLDLGAVLDFVTSNDIVGGSSGSPVVDARGQIVGAAFDGNQAAIAGDFAYDAAAGRTIAVSTAAIGDALANIYRRQDLLAELEANRQRSR